MAAGSRTGLLLLLWHLLLAFLVLPGRCQVLGDVFLYEAGRGEHDPVHFDPFPDLPADFGPEIPDEGVDGLLLVADPEDACQPLKFRYDDEPWVALISRSQHLHPTNCTFDVKVHNAELAGAYAAIVYDDVYEALIIMSKPRDHPEPGIPAVFVSEKAGIIMRKLMTPGVTRVRIVPVSASAWMSLLMSAFLGFLALTVVLATFYVMRSWSMWLGRTRRRGMAPELAGFGATGTQGTVQEGLPACAIRALPILIYEGKAAKRRSSSSGGGGGANSTRATPQGTAAATAAEEAAAASGPGRQGASAPVPIIAPGAAAAAAAGMGGSAAWAPSSPSMPATPQVTPAAAPATASGDLQHQRQHQPPRQQRQQSVGQLRHHAADAAVVLIESDSESDAGSRAQQQQQQLGGLGHRLAASSSSAVTSGLVSLASLAAAGSRRVLLMAGQSPSASPSNDLTGALAAAAGTAQWCAAAQGPAPAAGGGPTQAVDVPRTQPANTSAAAAAAAQRVDDTGDPSGPAPTSPAGSGSCRSSVYSTDEEEGEVPEVVQSWPGAGGMAHVVTGGPVGARGGATRHTCVVCLERYAAGDKVRVLPCQHRFHAKCIDPWLASRRLCPVCKHDASTWPSNSMQAMLAGAVPLDAPAPAVVAGAAGGAGAAREAGGGVSLLSVASSTGSVLLGRNVWFRRLRARLASASRRRQQQEQQQQLLLLNGGGAGGASASAAAAAVAAEAGLLQVPPAAVTVDVRQGPLQQQQQQQAMRMVHDQQEAGLREPLLGPEAAAGRQQ